MRNFREKFWRAGGSQRQIFANSAPSYKANFYFFNVAVILLWKRSKAKLLPTTYAKYKALKVSKFDLNYGGNGDWTSLKRVLDCTSDVIVLHKLLKNYGDQIHLNSLSP